MSGKPINIGLILERDKNGETFTHSLWCACNPMIFYPEEASTLYGMEGLMILPVLSGKLVFAGI